MSYLTFRQSLLILSRLMQDLNVCTVYTVAHTKRLPLPGDFELFSKVISISSIHEDDIFHVETCV